MWTVGALACDHHTVQLNTACSQQAVSFAPCPMFRSPHSLASFAFMSSAVPKSFRSRRSRDVGDSQCPLLLLSDLRHPCWLL